MVKSIAITGGIGCGKSQLRSLLEKLGYPCCNADDLAREILSDSSVVSSLKQKFGSNIFSSDGALDRVALRHQVFENIEARKALEAITHPAIATLYTKKKEALAAVSNNCWFFYEAALVFEAKREKEFNAIVVVTAKDDIRIKRLRENRNLAEDVVRKIMSSQILDVEKAKHADVVIDNSGDLNELESQAHALVHMLYKKFSLLPC